MSDESFFREVNEEIRQDRTRAIWSRFGRWFIAAAVLLVLATAGLVAWREYRSSRADASGDRYLAALDLATDGEYDEALTAFGTLAKDGFGAYRDLARLRIGAVQQAKGDRAAAIATFDAVAGEGDAPQALRDMAAVRAAYLLVDTGSLDDVHARVERLSGDAEPLRYPAREALGLASWKAGKPDDARRFFEALRDDRGTPSGIALRGRVMLDLIAGGTEYVAPATAGDPATAGATLPAPDSPLMAPLGDLLSPPSPLPALTASAPAPAPDLSPDTAAGASVSPATTDVPAAPAPLAPAAPAPEASPAPTPPATPPAPATAAPAAQSPAPAAPQP